MHKQQFLNATPNLFTKLHIHEIIPVHFLDFLEWYEVDTYIMDKPWQMKLIDDIINLRKWLFWKHFLVRKLHTYYFPKMVTSFTICLRSHRGWTPHLFPLTSSMSHVRKKTSTYRSVQYLLHNLGYKQNIQVIQRN